jgi:hypothetical protein
MNLLLISKKNILKPFRYQSPEYQAEVTIKSYEQKNNTVSKDIQHNLLAQNGSLPERVFQRKQSGRSRTYSPNYFAQPGLNFKIVQKRIEHIIEQFVIERIEKIKEVKRIYKNMMKKDNVLKLAEEMNKEVERIEDDIDRRKTQAINEVFSMDCY